jgi:hypothetical protein
VHSVRFLFLIIFEFFSFFICGPSSCFSRHSVRFLFFPFFFSFFLFSPTFSFSKAFQVLYSQGGVPRFYQGFLVAICLAPLSRFGAIVANHLAMHLVSAGVPMAVRTLLGAALGVAWRIFILPLDTVKSTMQVEGAGAFSALKRRIAAQGFGAMYSGARALGTQTLMSNFPFFLVYNTLDTVKKKQRKGK